MAMNSPGPYNSLKSPRSPRQLPQLPQVTSMTGQRSPSITPHNFTCKSPGTPRVFEFPPEYCPETPNANFDFEDFGKIESISGSRSNLLAESFPGGTSVSNSFRNSPIYSQHSPAAKSPRGAESKSPVFQFCSPRKNFGKTLSCPTKSPVSTPPKINSSSRNKSTSCGSPQGFRQKTAKSLETGRRNSCLSLGTNMSPTTIVTSSSRSPSPRAVDNGSFETCSNQETRDKLSKASNRDTESPKGMRQRLGSLQLNKSYGCLNEVGEKPLMRSTGKNFARKSTSDLTEFDAAVGDEVGTEVTVLSSPRRRGSMKGGLAYLASRRGSRDSQASNLSNVSNEDIGPLNFSAHPRGRQRRTSNFLELPVPDHIRPRVYSLPEKAYNPRAGDDLYRLRAFSITHKGVVNRGDSIISRRSRSNTSVNSSRNSNVSGERSPFDGSCCSGQGVAADSTESEAEDVPKYRVVLLGDSGVGKTALVSQFMTSEYMNTYDASLAGKFTLDLRTARLRRRVLDSIKSKFSSC
uniref:RABH1B protein n=1 Tax=Fopius arisanus TaxID=64838 RepID=A0A0C9R2C1_9HYME